MCFGMDAASTELSFFQINLRHHFVCDADQSHKKDADFFQRIRDILLINISEICLSAGGDWGLILGSDEDWRWFGGGARKWGHSVDTSPGDCLAVTVTSNNRIISN